MICISIATLAAIVSVALVAPITDPILILAIPIINTLVMLTILWLFYAIQFFGWF